MTNKLVKVAVAIIAIALLAGCVEKEAPLPNGTLNSTDTTPVYGYNMVNTYVHDQNAFTQGLVFADGYLYEGTGNYGNSTLRKVELETGKVVKLYSLPDQFFGEGITLWGDTLIQLTWRSKVGFVYDKDNLSLLTEFAYPTEGWGLTHDGTHLIMSDGTQTLYFLDPDTFEELRRLEVHDKDVPIANLNELDYIRGEIYANIWPTDRIARISPETGQVLGWVDLEGLLRGKERSPRCGVLNGIAYDAKHDRLFITGKNWPKLFELVL